MSKTKYVSMLYNGKDSNENDLSKLEKKLKKIRNWIIHNYDSRISCKVELDKFLSLEDVKVNIEEKQLGFLEVVLNKYISLAGVPYFIQRGSDYELVEKILRKRRKTLESRPPSSLAGKYVVDIESHLR